MARKQPSWWRILLAARTLDPEKITAQALATAAKLEGTERSSPLRMASGWLSKFHRWGYVAPNGTAPMNGRWGRVFRMTKYGVTRKSPGRSR